MQNSHQPFGIHPLIGNHTYKRRHNKRSYTRANTLPTSAPSKAKPPSSTGVVIYNPNVQSHDPQIKNWRKFMTISRIFTLSIFLRLCCNNFLFYRTWFRLSVKNKADRAREYLTCPSILPTCGLFHANLKKYRCSYKLLSLLFSSS